MTHLQTSKTSTEATIGVIVIAAVAVSLCAYRAAGTVLIGDAARQFDALGKEALQLQTNPPAGAEREFSAIVQFRAAKLIARQLQLADEIERQAMVAGMIAVVVGAGVMLAGMAVLMKNSERLSAAARTELQKGHATIGPAPYAVSVRPVEA